MSTHHKGQGPIRVVPYRDNRNGSRQVHDHRKHPVREQKPINSVWFSMDRCGFDKIFSQLVNHKPALNLGKF